MTLDVWRELYRSLGFTTIPLVPRGKRPLRKGWLDGGDEQWKDLPLRANLGILTGARSGGLVVLDFDTLDGPERILGMTPDQLAVVTIVVRTSRGWHVYTRSVGVDSHTPAEGLDVRADAGMVVAPPSIHASGRMYEFVGSCRRPVDLAAIAPQLCEPAGGGPVIVDEQVEAAEAWIALQAPKLQEAWRRLKGPPSMSFDASKADFAVARCLWEGGRSVEETAAILMGLPGSRARQRGERYAVQTAERARAARAKTPR